VLLAAAPAADAARAPKPPLCPPGRYLVAGEALIPGATPPLEVVEIAEDGTLAIASGCPAVAGKRKPTRKGTKLTARWAKDACPGLAGKPRLSARIEPTCVAMAGKLKAKGLKRTFTAALSRCGDEVDDPGEACPLLEGPADDPALDHVRDVFVPEGVPEAEIGEHGELGPVARTQLELGFEPDATVGEVNAAIEGAGASILAMLDDALWIVVRIPDPGSVEALEALAAAIDGAPGIAAVALAGFPEADLLPSNYLPPISGALANVDHHLAVRGAAAWNARSLLMPESPPLVVVSDHFGAGAPLAPDFDLFASAADFGAGRPNAQGHGYHVLGIIGGAFGGDGSNAGLVTGAVPGTVFVRAADWIDAAGNRMSTPQCEDLLLQRVRALQPPPVVANTSWTGLACRTLFGPAQCSLALAQSAAVRWIQKVRGNIGIVAPSGLEEQFLHVTAAANVRSGLPADVDSRLGSQFVAAALLPGLTAGPFGAFAVPNLGNVIAVENLRNGPSPFAPLCLSARSKRPGNLAAIGTSVWSMTAPSGTAASLDGTSMAAPQVAGFAAWLWTLRPTLTLLQLKAILLQTAQPSLAPNAAAGCDPATASAPVLDAYAAVLGADVPGNAPVRRAILDQDESGSFDEGDVEAFLDAFAESFGSLDWSRHDLNGDGYTGDDGSDPAATARIDLDMDDPPALEIVEQTLAGGTPVSFDETAARDTDVLCYYAYSPLYAGDPDERDLLLEHACCSEMEWVLTKLGIPPGNGSDGRAVAISDAGVVVAQGDLLAASRWTPQAGDPTVGAFSALPPLPGDVAVYVQDINAQGDVAGSSVRPGSSTAVVWEDGVPRAIGPAGAPSAASLNDAGIAAGGIVEFLGGGTFVNHGWVQDGDTVTFLAGDGSPTAINNAGSLAGSARTSTLVAYRPAFWPSATGLPAVLSGLGANSYAHDLNDAGLIVGSDHSPSPHPFRSPGGAGFARLPTIPGGFYAEEGDAYGVNEKGQIVGSLWLATSDEVLGERAVLWENGVPIDLNTLLSPSDTATFVLAEALDVNERGQIVGWGVDLPFEPFTYHSRAFLLTQRCLTD
jgi:probable HAF family extracellular repeat protein